MDFLKRNKGTVEEVPAEVIEVEEVAVVESEETPQSVEPVADETADVEEGDGANCVAPEEPAADVTDDAAPEEPEVSADVHEAPVEMEEPCGEVDIADESTLSIDGGVVEKIVAMTCRDVDGVLQLKGNFINSLGGLRGNDVTKGVSVEMFGEDACTVNVAVILEFGKSAPRVFQELHDKVAAAIESMTGLKVNAVNVRVTNVLTRAEAEGSKRKDKAEA